MLQFPAFMRQLPSPPLIPTSTLLPVAAHAQSDEDSLAVLESELEEKVWLFIPLPFSDPPLARRGPLVLLLTRVSYPKTTYYNPRGMTEEIIFRKKKVLHILEILVIGSVKHLSSVLSTICLLFCVIHLRLPYLQWSEIRKTNSNLPVMGRKIVDSKEELDAGAEDDDVDNVGESEGDEFEQETG
ncbi:unnamed protein product [Musa hybrid cultivar]